MTTAERIKFIKDKVGSNIKVAIEFEGYESNMKPDELYDVYQRTNSLSAFLPAYETAKRYSGVSEYKVIFEKMQKIEACLEEFCKKLAINSEVYKVDLSKIHEDIFIKHARNFEKKYKSSLALLSPDYFIG